MKTELATSSSKTPSTTANLPALIAREGEQAQRRFVEFFTANIRNPNTRAAYWRAVRKFTAWCEAQGLDLRSLDPVIISTYIEQLLAASSPASVKQSLAAIRHLFDYLVIGQAIPFNPADAVRGPKHTVREGKTPVLFDGAARALLESVDTDTPVGKRDHAILSVMLFSFARVGALTKMKVKDYHVQGTRAWFTLQEKGGKYRKIPAHHQAVESLERYIAAAGIVGDKDGPLFRSVVGGGRSRRLGEKPLMRQNVFDMIRRRAGDAGLGSEICCHSLRATGITVFLENEGSLEVAAEIAGHSSTKTTQLYDRRKEKVTLSEIERIRF